MIEDTAAFSLMSRVDKIVIGTHTVLANGGLKAVAGSHQILLTAKYFNVPVHNLKKERFLAGLTFETFT